MCLISTFINLNTGVLFVESPHCKMNLQIKIISDSHDGEKEEIDLNSRSYEVHSYGNEVNVWFSNAIGQPCALLRSSDSKYCSNKKILGLCRDVGSRLNFTNEAQFLLISEESVSDLNKRLSSTDVQEGTSEPVQVNPMRFRPNLLISGGEPYSEDGWTNLKIGNNYFTSLGGCNRCQMVNSVYQAGKVWKSRDPLATLASYRRVKGKILFGILLKYHFCTEFALETDSWLQVGQEMHPN
ncbi:molybdenum cofactor sulfurase isoform X2 [Carica papaya]|uniref:molybdenum cofactor sulfurase isoform X2 n=1 Tax=Carica papaya TaxID=3649 RepID=UPI000B8D1895|nr:molybdenum cofactor sulfurase isoform X2 [Carica papaya]